MGNKILITGGAGFIGINAASKFILDGWDVTIIDNLSRKGGTDNLKWLTSQGKYRFEKIDICNYKKIIQLLKTVNFDVVLHLAAQVAVTTSVNDPRTDFEINTLGTFNLLEAIREFNSEAFLIYSSTNKVYGEMKGLETVQKNRRYEYVNLPLGVGENSPLDFYSPYGCSKGSADQYVLDYSRTYGLFTVVFRQSCIYGTRQFGIEDQGWVAWFVIAAVFGKRITIYGDGKQVRDILHVNDLIDAFMKAIKKKDIVSGEVFNIGGGTENTMSLLELIDLLERKLGYHIPLSFEDQRLGDQKVFISNITKAKNLFNWVPSIDAETGIEDLIIWVKENKLIFF